MISWVWLIPAFLFGLLWGLAIMACMAQAAEADRQIEQLDPAWLQKKYWDEGRSGQRTRAFAPWHDPAWVRRKYHDEGLTQQQIADECGVHVQTIIKAMRQHGISGRGPGRKRDPGHPPADPTCNHSCPYWDDCLDWPVDAPCRLWEDRHAD